VIPGPRASADSRDTTLSAVPAETLHESDVSDTNVVDMHAVEPNFKISLKSTLPNSRPNTETLIDPVAGALPLIAFTDEMTAVSYENTRDRAETLRWTLLITDSDCKNPDASLHVIEDDAIHELDTHEEEPNLAKGLKS